MTSEITRATAERTPNLSIPAARSVGEIARQGSTAGCASWAWIGTSPKAALSGMIGFSRRAQIVAQAVGEVVDIVEVDAVARVVKAAAARGEDAKTHGSLP